MPSTIIVGGSLTGLMAGHVLKSLGHNIRILEGSTSATLQSQAAGIRAGPEVLKFLENYVKDYPRNFARRTEEVNVVDEQGNIVTACYPPEPPNLTTWKAMYDILKDALLRDSHNIAYETGRLVRNIEFVNQQVTVVYQNLENGQIERMSADLIIGADGAYSTVRKLVSGENSCLKYSGYVTWRGRVSENRLSRKTFEHLHYQAPTLRTEGGYILCYYVPGDPSQPAAQHCDEFVWVWYDAVPESSPEFTSIITDTSGNVHHSTVPRGKVRPDVWHRQLTEKRPKAFQNPDFVELLEKTEQPFVSAIRTYTGSKAVFCNGKVLLMGNALATQKPNAGVGTGQAAFHALALGKALRGEIDIIQWEKNCLEYADRAKKIAARMEGFYLTGHVAEALRFFVTPPGRSNLLKCHAVVEYQD